MTKNKTSKNEIAAVKIIERKFYSALNVLFTGDAEPIKKIWSHADDITYMGPMGGFQKGWKEISGLWDEQARLKLGGKVTPKHLKMTVDRDIAIAQNYEIGKNIGKNGRPLKVSIRSTNTYRKESGQWKMIGHHTDLLPHLYKNTA